MTELWLFIRIITNPRMWMTIHPYDKVWDHKLRRMLKRPIFEKDGQFTVVLNGVEIWNENRPYGCARPHNEREVRASRRTRLLFLDAYENWRMGTEHWDAGIEAINNAKEDEEFERKMIFDFLKAKTK